MKKKKKFEFVLSINDNIICQRFFTVRNHNPKTTRSVDLYESVKYIKTIINEQLISKTIDVIDEFFKEDVSKLQEENEVFTITIKKRKPCNNGKNILCQPLSTKSKVL